MASVLRCSPLNRALCNHFSIQLKVKGVSKRVLLLLSWIFALGISQELVDKVLFWNPGKIEYLEVELYQPRADLQYRLSELLKYISQQELYSKLHIEGQERNFNDEYVHYLLKYHNLILQLYELTWSRDIGMAIDKMSQDISKSIDFTRETRCVDGDEYSMSISEIHATFPELLKRLRQRYDYIKDYDKRLLAAKPDRDEEGNYDSDAVLYKVELIQELFSEPYLFVRTRNVDPLREFHQFMDGFDAIHSVYSNCTKVYNAKISEQEAVKKLVNLVIFIFITFLLYWKEMLQIRK
ncbi:hypothetical protein K6U44_13690 [Vibrio parahaemolyticus]|uniref:hypothetical protein n=1 Tax=Vibrio parahaemolyticus TaxID=670 RepID=UPI001EEA3D57|nr:hypothetical protein [Vibrio parahaemolyticus]MCG6461486.1 hypothetical protein [Vibrio parahaemolyticus]